MQTCHTQGVAVKPDGCINCHGDQHNGLTNCVDCHTIQNWTPSKFTHPQEGEHIPAARCRCSATTATSTGSASRPAARATAATRRAAADEAGVTSTTSATEAASGRRARLHTRRHADRLVLFDIDCTLIDAHGAGGRAILRAISDVYGVEGELGDYSFHGRTDPGIIADLAELWGGGEPGEVIGRYEGETQPQVVHDLAERLGTPDAAVDRLLDDCIARYVELLRDEIAGGRSRDPARASRSW